MDPIGRPEAEPSDRFAAEGRTAVESGHSFGADVTNIEVWADTPNHLTSAVVTRDYIAGPDN